MPNDATPISTTLFTSHGRRHRSIRFQWSVKGYLSSVCCLFPNPYLVLLSLGFHMFTKCTVGTNRRLWRSGYGTVSDKYNVEYDIRNGAEGYGLLVSISRLLIFDPVVFSYSVSVGGLQSLCLAK